MTYKKSDFIKDFQRLLKAEEIDDSIFEGCFEFFAGSALEGIHQQGTWYDGLILQSTVKRKSKQLKLYGKMWVALNKDQWLEPCEITITDKTITHQGVLIKFKIGNNKVEKSLDEIWFN